jgi:hypothetical protein
MQMQLGAAVDVAITLCGLFIALSTICSFLTEQSATFLQLRGNKLYSGILNLVFSRSLADAIFAHAIVDTSVNDRRGLRDVAIRPNRPSYIDPKNFAIAFWDEVANLVRNTAPPTQRAASAIANATLSNSPDRTRAAITLAALRATANPVAGTGPMPPDVHFEDLRAVVDALPEGHLKTNLLNLVSASAPTYDALIATTGAWFNHQMDRVSGWYNRQAQYIVIVFAALVVAVTGLDTIEIAQRLYAAPALLSAAESRVAGAFATPPPTDADRVAAARTAMNLIRGETFGGFLHPGLGLSMPWLQGNNIGDQANTSATKEQSIDSANLHLAADADREARSNLDDARSAVDTASGALSKASSERKTAEAAYAKASPGDRSARKSELDAKSKATTAAASTLRAAIKTAQDNVAAVKVAADALTAAQAQAASHGSHIWGWLCTFLAAALGAPFWFNLLGKFINVRGAGAKPA